MKFSISKGLDGESPITPQMTRTLPNTRLHGGPKKASLKSLARFTANKKESITIFKPVF